MSLVLVVPPEGLPVSLAEARAHLRVDHADDDTSIEGLIAAAVQWIDGADGWLGRALLPQTWELRLGCFDPDGLWLPLRPLRSVDSVHYVGPAGDIGEMDPGDFHVTGIGSSYAGRIFAKGGWPAVSPDAEAVRVRYAVGYDPAGAETRVAGPVPRPIVQAILLLVGQWYGNRSAINVGSVSGNSVDPLPFAVDALLAPYRVYA